MYQYIFRSLLAVFLLIYSCSGLWAQEERRISLSLYTGAAFFSKDKKNDANLTTRALGGFKPAPLVGLGLYYRLSPHLYAGESYTFLFGATNSNRNLSSHTFRTSLKYYILTEKKINPYIGAGFNVNMVTLKRSEREELFVPPAGNSNVVGSGLDVDYIIYREKELKLSNMPMLGASLGAGFDIKLSKRFNFFAEYNLNMNAGKTNPLIEQYYFSNQSNFMYHTVSAGVNMKFFKPKKQLLAKLKPEDWRNSKPIDVKGTIIYKKSAKLYNKVLPVEKTDTLANKLELNPTEETGLVFFSRNIEMGHYQFMLPKKKRRIIRADLQILNYNKIEIEDDELEIDMVEDDGSENILSRDANFAVMLREGFQHEVELTTTAENIMGTLDMSDPDCLVRVILKDQNDSVIAIIDTLKDKTFNFVDVEPGNYKVTFQRMNKECSKTEFRYAFTGATPYIRRQSNLNEPEDTIPVYSIRGKVAISDTKPEAPKGTVAKLIDPSGRVESSTSLGGPKTDFAYTRLSSPNYEVVYEDPSDKASLNYAVKDRKDQLVRQVKKGPAKKAPKGDIVVKGKLDIPNPALASAVSVLLVDSTGKIRQKAPLKPDGSFSFDNLAKNKYRIAYESTDPLVKGKLNYSTIDKSLKVNKVELPELTSYIEEADTIHFTKKGPGITDTNPDPVKKTTKTKETPVKYLFTQFKPGTTYNDLGYEVKPEGYGVQISSFFITSNLEKFCQRVRAKGEKNIYIQVIQKDKTNPDAGLIYRVIIGADDDKEKTLKKLPQYIDKGYDAVLRKHLP